MTRQEIIHQLNGRLLDEMPEYRPQAAQSPQDESGQRRLLRSLMNLRPPMPLRQDFLAAQDEFLAAGAAEKGVVDAIVNAANSALLGCFCPCHGCIDNAIHSAAGLQLRNECNELMRRQGHPEPNGRAKLTKGYTSRQGMSCTPSAPSSGAG